MNVFQCQRCDKLLTLSEVKYDRFGKAYCQLVSKSGVKCSGEVKIKTIEDAFNRLIQKIHNVLVEKL